MNKNTYTLKEKACSGKVSNLTIYYDIFSVAKTIGKTGCNFVTKELLRHEIICKCYNGF